jgi:hypothetical protein
MKIVFFLGLLVCGSGYVFNKDRLAKNELELNRSVVTLQRKFGSSKAMSIMSALLKNESVKFEQAIKNSKMYDICVHLYNRTKVDEFDNRIQITTPAPKNKTKGVNFGKLWHAIEVFYWLVMFAAAGGTIHLMTQVAIKDVEGSSSTYTPLHMECYPKLKNALNFFKETSLVDYEDPCTLPGTQDCDDAGLTLSPIRAFSRCVMDNMNEVVGYQRDALIKITLIQKSHSLFDQIATHMAIDSSSDKVKAELAQDAEEDEDQEFDAVREICSMQKKFDKFSANVQGHFDDIVQSNREI